MVGAGCSCKVRYPSWKSLLTQLESLAVASGSNFEKSEEKKAKRPLEYVDEIKSHIKTHRGTLDDYERELFRIFDDKPPFNSRFHEALIRLPFCGVLTTNYDNSLELALRVVGLECANRDHLLVVGDDSPPKSSDFLRSLCRSSKLGKRIAHLHGHIERRRSIVLSESEYRTHYGIDERSPDLMNLVRKFLWTIFATRPVVFVGFSMTDPYLTRMLEMVQTDFWSLNRQIHYAIFSIEDDYDPSRVDHLKGKYGVASVFYEKLDETHSGLDNLVFEIEQLCLPSNPIEEKNQSPQQAPSPPPVAEIQRPAAQAWLSKADQEIEVRIKDRED